jgi:hypothetical protein
MSSHALLKPLSNLRSRTDQLVREPFPYYFNDPLKNTVLAAAYSAVVMTLLAVMQNSFELKVIISGITTFAVLYVNIVLLPRLFPSLLDPRQWTVGKYMVFSLWKMLLCGIAIPVACHLSRTNPDQTFLSKVILIFPKIFFYGAIPQIILTLAIRNFMLRQSLRNAHWKELSESLQVHEPPLVSLPDTATEDLLLNQGVARIQSDTRETVEFPIKDWLFVEANDNYVTFYWRTLSGIQKRMLRMNLRNAEEQLDKARVLRCHRSFLVNLEAVGSVTGNANGYKLVLRNCESLIPVSRSRGKEIVERLAEASTDIRSPQKQHY